jgi:hypothetical protein
MPKSDLMDNCPLCEMIAEGKVISKGDHCCVLHWVDREYEGYRKVAVVSTHTTDISPEATAEALQLLGFTHPDNPKQPQTLLLREFDVVAGHWGVQVAPAGEVVTIGSSVVRNS